MAMKFQRITVNPYQMGGVPCIRGLLVHWLEKRFRRSALPTEFDRRMRYAEAVARNPFQSVSCQPLMYPVSLHTGQFQ